jgi:hypothetical protein
MWPTIDRLRLPDVLTAEFVDCLLFLSHSQMLLGGFRLGLARSGGQPTQWIHTRPIFYVD